MAPPRRPRLPLRALALRATSFAGLILAWTMVARFFPPSVLPGPGRVLVEVWAILTSGEFLFHMGKTLLRVGVGFAIAFLVSTALGLVMGSWRDAEHFFEVEVLVGLTIPGLAWAMMSMLWFGIRDAAAIFAITIITVPMITLNIWEGTKALDSELSEMARAFRARPWLRLRHVILPQLLPYLLASTRFGFALAWKVVVLSELLGLSNGIGFMINQAFGLFRMEGVMAWTLAFTLVMILIEFGILKLVERRATRWRPVVSVW